MSELIERRLNGIPIIKQVVILLKKVKLPGFEGLSLYDFLEMYVVGIIEGALTTRASAIAFSFFIALFPFLLFLLSLVPYIRPMITIADFDYEVLRFIESFIPKGTTEYVGDMYDVIKEQKRGGILSTTFLFSIFLIGNGVNAVFTSFSYSYHLNLPRNFFRQYVFSLFVGFILSLFFFLAAVGLIYYEFYILEYLYDSRDRVTVQNGNGLLGLSIARFLFLSLLTYFGTALLYYFGTDKRERAKFFSLGALVTTLLYLVTSYLFGVYLERFATYNQFYGSVGALVAFLLYLWLNSIILLLGFDLNLSLKRIKGKS